MKKANPVMLTSGLRMIGEPTSPDEGAPTKEKVNLFREGPTKAWIERPMKDKKQKQPILAHGHKFCTACGNKFYPEDGELQVTWYKVRTCGEDCKAKGKPIVERGGKFCMNCGKFHTIAELLERGVDPSKGLSTWSSCCKPSK